MLDIAVDAVVVFVGVPYTAVLVDVHMLAVNKLVAAVGTPWAELEAAFAFGT